MRPHKSQSEAVRHLSDHQVGMQCIQQCKEWPWETFDLKEHYVVLGKTFQSEDKDLHWLIFLCLSKLYKQSLLFHDWISWINKLNLKGQHRFIHSFIHTLFIFGGSCHLSSFRQWSRWPYIPLRTVMETVCIFTTLILYTSNFSVVISFPKLLSDPVSKNI